MNESSYSESYKRAGVDVTRGYRAVELMKESVARTVTPGVLSGLGGFGGLFAPDFSGMREPVLVSGTDGVGTKLKLAFLLDKHDTVGIDCVAMSVNDIVCSLAKPLFFLDYIACGKNVPERIAQVVAGVAEGCVQAGCALLGGETAEMPGFYPENEYDLAGFAVGIADKGALPSKENISAGDVVLALPSSGVHSNGFSLVRHVLPDLTAYCAELSASYAECLLTPTRIYVRDILALADAVTVKGVSHITGGGFFENIPRCLPGGFRARVDMRALRTPPIFPIIQAAGNIPARDMFNTFNMGVGMCVVVRESEADAALKIVPDAYILGVVEEGDGGVRLC